MFCWCTGTTVFNVCCRDPEAQLGGEGLEVLCRYRIMNWNPRLNSTHRQNKEWINEYCTYVYFCCVPLM